MGLLDNVNLGHYYHQSSNSSLQPGHYQFVTMDNIINAFLLVYVGEDKLINKVSRTDVQFYAMRAIQELSYDVFRSIKSHEIEVPQTLRMILPHDYVNYVKVVRVGSDGIERVLYPTSKTSNPFAIQQNSSGTYVMNYDDPNVGVTLPITDQDVLPFTLLGDSSGDGVPDNEGELSGGNLSLTEQGTANTNLNMNDANTETPFASNTIQNWNDNVNTDPNAADTVDIELDNLGRRYGLDPQHAQANGTFFIDNRTGFINFGSSLAGETIILKYVSDGMGTDDEMVVHKFCEEACYKWIAYGILASKSNTPEYIIQRYKKEKFAETRKAKIRLSNIKIEEFTQILKGMGKQIK